MKMNALALSPARLVLFMLVLALFYTRVMRVLLCRFVWLTILSLPSLPPSLLPRKRRPHEATHQAPRSRQPRHPPRPGRDAPFRGRQCRYAFDFPTLFPSLVALPPSTSPPHPVPTLAHPPFLTPITIQWAQSKGKLKPLWTSTYTPPRPKKRPEASARASRADND